MNLKEILDLKILDLLSIRSIIDFSLRVLFIYAFCLIAVHLVKVLFRRAQTNKAGKMTLDHTTAMFLQRIAVYAIYIIGGSVLLSHIPGVERLGDSILASAGIMAMAVGFASQEALSNFISGLFIVFGKPIRIGDTIKLDAESVGTVHEITLRHTVIRSLDNRMIIIPNSKINSSTIINSTIGDTQTCAFIEVGVSYAANLDQAMDVMRQEIMKHPLLIDRRTPEEKQAGVDMVTIRVIELGDSAITLKAWAWGNNAGDAFVLKCDSLKNIKERFDKEQIEIPFPCRNIYMKQN